MMELLGPCWPHMQVERTSFLCGAALFTALVCHSHTNDSAQLLELSLLFITTPLLWNTWQHQLKPFCQAPGSFLPSCPVLFNEFFFKISFTS